MLIAGILVSKYLWKMKRELMSKYSLLVRSENENSHAMLGEDLVMLHHIHFLNIEAGPNHVLLVFIVEIPKIEWQQFLSDHRGVHEFTENNNCILYFSLSFLSAVTQQTDQSARSSITIFKTNESIHFQLWRLVLEKDWPSFSLGHALWKISTEGETLTI